jgi:hypothetical protein
MTIREVGGVGTGEDEGARVSVSPGTGHEGIADRFGIELAFGVEEVVTDATEDVVGEAIGTHKVGDGLIDPDGQRDRSVVDFGLADQVNSVHLLQDTFGIDGESEVRFFVATPFFAELFPERFEHLVDHGPSPHTAVVAAGILPFRSRCCSTSSSLRHAENQWFYGDLGID